MLSLIHVNLSAYALIILALIFEFLNGFHDTANTVATSISTKSLGPFQAISIAAIFNIIGALSGTAVAVTIISGFASPVYATPNVLCAALLSAISWNIITWLFALPTSSSHALIGGLVGGIIFNANIRVIHFKVLLFNVILPMIVSPILGFILSMFIAVLLLKIFSNNTKPRKTNNILREFQVLSTAFLSYSHGANDSQKTIGIITLILFNFKLIGTATAPSWVIFICGLFLALGTFFGGISIIKTLSTRVAKLSPSGGVASELSSAILLLIASKLGMPLSTTHAISGAIMGAGWSGSKYGVNWGVVKSMVINWVLTLPSCILISGFILHILNKL